MNTDLSNVININTEMLYRSAEDDFFYFNKINSAYNKLSKALLLTPKHLKSMLLLADIVFIKGCTQKALSLFLEAEKIDCNKIKTLASIANCYYQLNDYDNAILYCDKVFEHFYGQNILLFSQILEIKLNILMFHRKYNQAYETWHSYKKLFNTSFFNEFQTINYKILNEKLYLQKKIKKSGLKIV